MQKVEVSLDELLFGGLALDVWAYFVTLVLRSTAVRHAITFVGCVLVWLIITRKLITKPVKKYFVLGLLSLIFIIVLNLFNGEVVLFDYLYSSLCYLAFFSIMSTDNNYNIKIRIRKYIRWMIILISITIISLSFSSVAYLFEDGRKNGAMALGMTNSNLAGILVFLVYSLVLSLLLKSKRKVPFFLLLAFLMYILWMTRSRSAVLSALVVTFFYYFRHKPFRKWQIVACLATPILFIVGYLWLYRSSYANIVASFMGKPLFTGREIIYMNELGHLDSVFQMLVGNIPSLYFRNAHNGPLVIFCNLGLIGLCESYYCFARQLLIDNGRVLVTTENSIHTISTILAIYILSCGEGSIFMGAFPGIALVLLVKVF